MHDTQPLQRVVDLTDASKNIIYNMTVEAAREILKHGNAKEVRAIDGQFALVALNARRVELQGCATST